MKIRHHRKRKQALFRSHRAFLWSTQKFALLIAKEYDRAMQQIRESYIK